MSSPPTSPISASTAPTFEDLVKTVKRRKTTSDRSLPKPRALPKEYDPLEKAAASQPEEAPKLRRTKAVTDVTKVPAEKKKSRGASAPLKLWSEVVKEATKTLGIKPPIRKGTKEYDELQKLYQSKKPTPKKPEA